MPTIEQWHAAGKTRTCNGQDIFYVDSNPLGGDRPTLFLIHGFPTAGWDFCKIWPALTNDYRVIAADMLGFGFSAKPAKHNYTIHEQADLLESLIEQLGLGRLHVLAHDYGDTVAQEMLARDNARGAQRQWLSLALLNGGLFPETHRARPIQKLLNSPVGGLFAPLLGQRAFKRSLAAVFGAQTQPSESELDAFWELFSYAGGQRNIHRLIRYIRDRLQHRERWLAALRDATIPIQLINGSADPVSGAHMVARYRQLVGERNIVELAGIGHYPQVEAPAAVAAHYTAFLEKQQTAAASSTVEPQQSTNKR